MLSKTLDLMRSLRLKGMAGVLERELARAEKEGLAPADVISRLVLEELHHWQERSLMYRIDQAAMPWPWTLQTFPFHRQPGVSKSQITSLASLAFVERAEKIVFIGDPGVGKTGLATGLLREALVSGLRGRFYKAQDLLDELYASLADRSTPKLRKRLVRYDLLVIDEVGLPHPEPRAGQRLLQAHGRTGQPEIDHHHIQPRLSPMVRAFPAQTARRRPVGSTRPSLHNHANIRPFPQSSHTEPLSGNRSQIQEKTIPSNKINTKIAAH